MSVYRKRRPSKGLESERKRSRYSNEPKQEYDSRGRMDYSGVPYNYNNSVTPIRIQNVAYHKPSGYNNNNYVEAYKYSGRSNVISPPSNYNYNDAIIMYDEQRQMNFQHEVYINSLRQSESRYVNFNDLRRHLSDIDIRCPSNWNFRTAYDLTEELESSLKYYIDTRNELICLRKLHRHQYVQFSYNEINITNKTGLLNRTKFLENESAYRSYRMNQLFHKLQSVVIPSIIDDIRYVHRVAYDESWTHRARYWFNQFKQIKWQKGLSFNNHQTTNGRSQKQRSNPKYRQRVKEEVEVRSSVDIKSEVVIMSHVSASDGSRVNIDKIIKVESNGPNRHHHQRDSNNNHVNVCVEKLSGKLAEPTQLKDFNGNFLLNNNLLEQLQKEPTQLISCAKEQSPETAIEKKLDEHQADGESVEKNESADKSVVIIEPNVSVVSVTDEDNHDTSDTVDPPEGDITN